jgi:hypothetical protein
MWNLINSELVCFRWNGRVTLPDGNRDPEQTVVDYQETRWNAFRT